MAPSVDDIELEDVNGTAVSSRVPSVDTSLLPMAVESVFIDEG